MGHFSDGSDSQNSDRMAAAIKQLPGVVRAYAKPRWATFVKYGKVELTPPTPGEIPTAIGQAAGLVKSAATFRWTQVTVKEATVNALVATEVLCWFFVGECIGKMGLI